MFSGWATNSAEAAKGNLTLGKTYVDIVIAGTIAVTVYLRRFRAAFARLLLACDPGIFAKR